MKINLAKSRGFCFGVKRALDIARKTAKSNNKVFMLGDIVHNEDVVKKIEQSGIKKINRLSKVKNKILLIRAHGAAGNIIHKARRLGYKIIDATCPMVKEIHKIAQNMEKKGYKIIVIGDKKHDEVQGIIGQLKGKALVIDKPEHIPSGKLKRIKKGCIVIQSTQNVENALIIAGILKQRIPDLRFFNTICRPTRMKQEEIKKMPSRNDVMIIIGSKTSANTKRLYEISKSLNRNTYWVSAKKEIKPAWFKDARRLGIAAGASTPDTTTEEITAYIKRRVS